MMDIKFRAWDEQASQMIYDFKNTSRTAELNENGILIKSCWQTLNQFTGINDKNGKEVYEGDIIDFELGFQSGDFDGNYRGIQGYHSENGFRGKIMFDEKRLEWSIQNIIFHKAVINADYVFNMNRDSWTKNHLFHYCNIKCKPLRKANSIEIIGDIYRTPELLK